MVRKIEIERFSLTTSKQFDVPKIVRLLIGNELIMKEMAKHVADAGSYAPVTVLVDEPADGVHFSYDKMTSLLAPYENREALEVARDLDRKFEDLLRHAATARRPSDGQAGSNPKVRVADNWRVDTMGCLGNRAGSPFHGSFTCSALPSSSERQT